MSLTQNPPTPLADPAAHEIDPYVARVALGAEVGLSKHARAHARGIYDAARLATLLVALAACGGRGAGRDTTDASPRAGAVTTGAPATSPSAPRQVAGALGPCAPAAGRDSLCFRATRTYDFARDGRAFTVTVDARGPAPDSMRVALRIQRGDTTHYRADWSTALYDKYDAGPVSRDSSRRRVEHHLTRLLADSAFRPARALLGGASDVDRTLREVVEFDVAVDGERQRRGLSPADTLPTAAAGSPRLVNDTARVRALVAELRDAPAFRYYAGGEATYAVAWSAAERRFVVVLACC